VDIRDEAHQRESKTIVKISGFSFARNAETLGYPVVESIQSILPICDEFVIAVGKGDAGDRTREMIERIGSPKIQIIDTQWTDRETLKGAIYSQQTNIALSQCTGDWCFYIQADEVLHEQFLPKVQARCEQLLDNTQVEGLLFAYRHFWGDYNHYQESHSWYPFEIRIVRNRIGVASIGDAQSFRRSNEKLQVALAQATMFHYGYVRHPGLMQHRNKEIETTYQGSEKVAVMFEHAPDFFDFGPLENLPEFTGSHPAVLERRIAAMNWAHLLRNSGPKLRPGPSLKHRILTKIEKTFLGGKQIGGYKNYVLVNEV
jgi:hypothetical protein